MKILNTKFGRQAIAAALILSAMASMSLGAFAAAICPRRTRAP